MLTKSVCYKWMLETLADIEQDERKLEDAEKLIPDEEAREKVCEWTRDTLCLERARLASLLTDYAKMGGGRNVQKFKDAVGRCLV